MSNHIQEGNFGVPEFYFLVMCLFHSILIFFKKVDAKESVNEREFEACFYRAR